MAKVRFQERELTRAIRAADRAGQQVSTIHIDRDGQVTLQVARRSEQTEEQPTAA
jgi:hypothetical protein